jgi:hypothetical protein
MLPKVSPIKLNNHYTVQFIILFIDLFCYLKTFATKAINEKSLSEN